MSLVGFKARNHPQQKADVNVDDRAITLEDFALFDARFHFTVDVAASYENRRVPIYYDTELDGLAQSWAGHRVWCNPPYSNIEPWVRKAMREHNQGCELIVMLLPANRTEQGWWQRLIEGHRDWHRFNHESPLTIEFLPGRMRFLRNGATDIKPNERPPFGCCLAIWQATP